MLALIRKYWLRILIFLLLSFVLVYFLPKQEEYYLRQDVDDFKRKAHSTLIVLEIVVWSLFLILFLRGIRSIKEVLRVAFFSVAILFVTYTLFKDTFTSMGLFVNRLVVRGETKRSCIMQKSVASIYDGCLIDSAYHSGVSSNDTVLISFKKGLLGVEYPERPNRGH